MTYDVWVLGGGNKIFLHSIGRSHIINYMHLSKINHKLRKYTRT